MYWVVSENTYRERGIEDLLDVLHRGGIPHSVHKVIPFVGELEPDIDIDGPVMLIGPYSMRRVAGRKGWTPGVFDLGDVTYADHVARWGGHMLNSDATYCSLAEVPDRLSPHLSEFFIRPEVDSKFFSGRVIDRAELARWLRTMDGAADGSSLRRDTMVMTCAPKPISSEYRLWVVDGTVVTASLYRRGDRVLYSSNVDADIVAFGAARAAEWQPQRAFVLDVALIPDGTMRVIETNTFNSAGLYAANVGRIVEAVMGMEFAPGGPDTDCEPPQGMGPTRPM